MGDFKPAKEMSDKEFMDRFLPVDHNEQDIIYLKARYRWEKGEADFDETTKAYGGTTFEQNQACKN